MKFSKSYDEHLNNVSISVLFQNATVLYGAVPALLNISLSIPVGSFTAVIGPKGGGKSTFLKAILGTAPLLSGAVYLFSKKTNPRTNNIAYVPYVNSVNWNFPASCKDIIKMGAYNFIRRKDLDDGSKIKMKDRINDVMRRVGLDTVAHKRISELSNSEKQLLLFARALVQDAPIILLDEPYEQSDEYTAEIITDVLLELNHRRNTTVIMSHHDTITIPACFENIVLLNSYLVSSGSADKIFTEANFKFTYGNMNRVGVRLIDQLSEPIDKL